MDSTSPPPFPVCCHPGNSALPSSPIPPSICPLPHPPPPSCLPLLSSPTPYLPTLSHTLSSPPYTPLLSYSSPSSPLAIPPLPSLPPPLPSPPFLASLPIPLREGRGDIFLLVCCLQPGDAVLFVYIFLVLLSCII